MWQIRARLKTSKDTRHQWNKPVGIWWVYLSQNRLAITTSFKSPWISGKICNLETLYWWAEIDKRIAAIDDGNVATVYLKDKKNLNHSPQLGIRGDWLEQRCSGQLLRQLQRTSSQNHKLHLEILPWQKEEAGWSVRWISPSVVRVNTVHDNIDIDTKGSQTSTVLQHCAIELAVFTV